MQYYENITCLSVGSEFNKFSLLEGLLATEIFNKELQSDRYANG